jgi:hypothetical protein
VSADNTLEQLENCQWPAPDMVGLELARCHALRKTPLQQFSVDDVRIMILHKMSLDHLVPMALDILLNNPLAEGSSYKGELLDAVLRINDDFWIDHPDLNNLMLDIKQELEQIADTIHDDLLPELGRFKHT